MSLSGQWCLGSALIYAHYNYVRVDVMILGIGVKILEGFIYGIKNIRGYEDSEYHLESLWTNAPTYKCMKLDLEKLPNLDTP